MNKKEPSLFPLISKYRSELMGFAALWILFFHKWVCLFTDFPVIGLVEEIVKNFGYVGVDIFFFLSGTGLCYAIEKYSVGKFYARRFARILFPYIVVTAIVGILHRLSFVEILKNASGWSFVAESIFSVQWFVPAIAIFYLLFPLYYLVFSKAKNPILFTIAVIEIWVIVSIKLDGVMRSDLFGITNRIPVFLAGVGLGQFCKKKEIVCDRSFKFGMFATLVLGAYLCFLTNFRNMYLLVPISNVAVPAMLLACALAFFIPYILGFTEKCKPVGTVLRFYGSFSLELYLVSEPLGDIVIPRLYDLMPHLIVNILFLIMVTAVSYLLHLLNTLVVKCFIKD